jgi:hypothetical protein
MILSKEHGLNPTMPVCYWCGEETGEVALLGAAYKGEAPMHMVLNKEPCPACKAKLDSLEWSLSTQTADTRVLSSARR